MSVRVRFAPSPTGYLHVGGLRTALYNYLFARHHGGKCILRIEDTDRTRFVENATENLISSLKWAGIEFDESIVDGGDFGPYIQSERFDLYKKYGAELLEKDMAYYAFDTPEELDAMRQKLQKEKKAFKYDRNNMRNQYTLGAEETKRLIDEGNKYVIRLKVPEKQTIEFKDIIRGRVKVNSNEVDDQVLLKSDGFPTYHLANVVDDHLMHISHVIRGEEWLPSTPKHVVLYQAFGWDCPEFAHLPLLLNADKSKLSKRQGSVAVEDFVAEGYTRDAFVNFVALLGWNPSADREIYNMEELIESFKLEKVNKGGAVFDRKKLAWMNGQYIHKMSPEQLADMLMPMLADKGYDVCRDYVVQVAELFRERINFVHELPDMADYMFVDPTEYEEKYLNKHWTEGKKEIMQPLINLLRSDNEFSKETTHDITMKYVEDSDLKLKDVIHPLRLMITGKSKGAGMFETMAVVGKEFCMTRIDKFMETH